MFLLICKLYICIQNVFGHIFYRSRLHLYWQFWQFEVQKLAYMLILAAGGSSPYLSSVPPAFMEKSIKNFHVVFWKTTLIDIENVREGFQKKSGYFNDICH